VRFLSPFTGDLSAGSNNPFTRVRQIARALGEPLNARG
jgi:hypothetical protein